MNEGETGAIQPTPSRDQDRREAVSVRGLA